MKRIFLLLLVSVFLSTNLYAWELPKRDVRAVWLTTGWGLDWPGRSLAVRVPAPIFDEDGVTIINEVERERVRNDQKTRLLNIIERLEEANFNTIYFQVRPMSDAFYRSRLPQPEPWSQWLSSVRGADPGWSPLEFLIEHAHARGMEVHAWLNPYRYSTDPNWDWSSNLPNDYENTHPEWLLDYGHRGTEANRTRPVILNPGIPEVRQRIADIVEDIITHYNVDGIVFDDYFYVSGTTNAQGQALDQAQFDTYRPNNSITIEDWRIENINQMIRDVQARIREVRPEVVWGVSPAGVAASSSSIAAIYGVRPCPSGTDWQRTSLSASPLAWLRDGSIDFISPQIYWDTTPTGNNFRLINDWWAEISNHFGRHYFSSNTSHAGGNSDNARFSTAEILNQLQLTRDADRSGTAGAVHFRFDTYLQSTLDAFVEVPYQFPALTAIYGWKPAPMQGLVANLNVSGQNVTWDYTRVGIPYVRYAVYAVPIANRDDAMAFASPRYLQGVSYTTKFTLRDGVSASTHKIAVAVYDRFGNLFPPRVFGESTTTIAPAQLTFPANGQTDVPIPGPVSSTIQQRSGAATIFTWQENGADFYVWQIAEDAAFERPIASRETTVPNFSLALQTNIRPNTTYYWRVKSIKANAPVSVSEVRAFSGTATPAFRITAPARGAFNQSLTPTITWTNLGAGVNYTFEISTHLNFDEILHTANTTATSFVVPSGLLHQSNTYYVRVKATHQGRSLVTEFTYFSTSIADPLPFSVPTITSPVNGDTIFGTEIDVVWEVQRSRGFVVQLSQNSAFPSINRRERRTSHLVHNFVWEDVREEGTWHMRVRAVTDDGGNTNFSDAVTVYLLAEKPSSLPEISTSEFFSFVYRVSDGIANLVINQTENNSVAIDIFSLTGNLIDRQVHGLDAGTHTLTLDMMGYSRGVYIVRVNSGNNTKTLKVHR